MTVTHRSPCRSARWLSDRRQHICTQGDLLTHLPAPWLSGQFMTNGDDARPAAQSPDLPALPADLHQMIRQLQARQAELEAENHALRQSHATRVDAMVDPDVVSAAIPSIATLEAEAQRHALQERVRNYVASTTSALLNRGGLPQGELARAIVDRLPAAYPISRGDLRKPYHRRPAFLFRQLRRDTWQQSGIVAGGNQLAARSRSATWTSAPQRTKALHQGRALAHQRGLHSTGLILWSAGVCTKRWPPANADSAP